jgi:hypothetical protein
MTRPCLYPPSGRSRKLLKSCTLSAVASLGSCLGAVELDTGNPELIGRWDHTLKYSSTWRLRDPSPGLTQQPAAANLDDGNRNFKKGLISSRLDVLSELDLVYRKNYGLRISAAAWYDQVYNRRNDNPGLAGGAAPNQQSTADNVFSDATRRLHGRQVELLDAFIFGGVELGSSKLNLRLGSHTIQWGESLFFGDNAIAGGMAPSDVIKLNSVPGTQFKEALIPVPQLSAQLRLNRRLSLGAYYQFSWRKSRLPAVGSYFSNSDTFSSGAETILTGDGMASRLADRKPKSSGQGGLQLRYQTGGTDYGIYLIRFHSKSGQVVPVLSSNGPGGVIEHFYQAYHEGVSAFGASASRNFGSANLAIEASLRRNQDLPSSHSSDQQPSQHDNHRNPAYAVGRTAHINLSAIWDLPATGLAREATLQGEIAWNRLLSVTKNAHALDTKARRHGLALRMQLEPTYRQVWPGLDLGVPLGLGYSPQGRTAALNGGFPAHRGGDFSIGLNGRYLESTRFKLSYTHYFGAEALQIDSSNNLSWQQTLKDRNFIALSISTTF